MNQLEKWLEAEHEALRRRHMAYMVKVPNPTTITSRTKAGKIRGHINSAVFVDFVGCLSGGRLVAIEAKEIDGKSTSFPIGRINDHQLQCLIDIDDMGGIAALMIAKKMNPKTATRRLMYFVPVAFIIETLGTRKSMTWDSLRPFLFTCITTEWIAAARYWSDYSKSGWLGVPHHLENEALRRAQRTTP